MDQQIAVIGEDPLRLVVAFDTDREFAGLVLELEIDFVADGLHLALVAAGADYEVIGERGDAGEIQDPNVGGLFCFSGPNGE